jgi:hypothetical protein
MVIEDDHAAYQNRVFYGPVCRQAPYQPIRVLDRKEAAMSLGTLVVC